MEEALKSVRNESMGLREAARAYNVPVETLRRRVAGVVSIDCRSGPPTVLTSEEEARLAEYCVSMADMGFGLTREGIMAMAYAIVEKTGRNHPFKSGHAGRGWYESFMSRQPLLTLRTPQAMSYARAVCANKERINDFFAKLGAIFGRLNLISKPGQIFNADETGVTIVHKPAKVIAQVGRRNVPALTSAEKGRTHTILSCVSASGQVIPPFMVYPRKRPVPPKMREGAYPNTFFQVSDNGWITKELFFEWFKLFVQAISPIRPVLLILDGHTSHITINVIEFARANEIHLLCLPSHTSHVLQPLDVGVFKSFKSFFSKVCTQYMAKNPGRVITEDILSFLVGNALAQSHTPINIFSGFKKAGIYPFNPGEVSDRQLAPSKAHNNQLSQVPLQFSPEQVTQFEKQYTEGYDVPDPNYLAWKNIHHPSPESIAATASDSPTSVSVCGAKSTTTATSADSIVSVSVVTTPSLPSSEEVLSELLVLPNPVRKTGRTRSAINQKAIEISNSTNLQEMKDKEQAKADAKTLREERKLERQEKAKERQKEKEKKQEKERKAQERQKQKEEKVKEKKAKKRRPKCSSPSPAATLGLESLFDQLDIVDNGQCFNCELVFNEEDEDRFWVCCDGCDNWYCFACHKIPTKDSVPDEFYCTKCT